MVDATGNGAITGAVMSWTLIVCDAVEKLPHASVAVQFVTLYSPAQSPKVVTSFDVSENALPQPSIAVATAKMA